MISKCLCSAALLATLLAAGAGAAPVPAKEKPTRAEAKKAVQDHLAALKGPSATVTPLDEGALERALPASFCFGVRYRQWPLAVRPPSGLQSSNVFVVKPDGKVVACSDVAALGKAFGAAAAPATTKKQLQDGGRAWLLLVQEMHQDGFYKFAPMEEVIVEPSKGGQVAWARSVVMAGGNGMLKVAVRYNARGEVTEATETSAIKRGTRPRCQATKLLDADPLVRRMAEANLLSMGRHAKPYLDEQHGKASPELREAIDRIWQQIVERGSD